MAYWLLKSEPGDWSWDDQVKKGKTGEPWDGVRNHQAANNLKAMAKGDKAFFYHSVNEKRIVGTVKVIKTAYPDPTDESGRFVAVTVEALKPMPEPVTLAQIKATPALAEIALVRQSRLSVMPITEDEWALICEMGGMKG